MLSYQKKLNKLFYVVLGLPATAMGFGLSVQIAVLSWILSSKYGLDIHEVGIVWAAGPIAGILGQIIVGVISDKVWFWGGRRKPFIIIGGILAAIMIYCLPRLDLIDHALGIGNIMAVAITVALTLDLSINVGFNPTRSIIADVTPEGNHRTKGFSWMQAISNFFGASAYLISALLDNYLLMNIGIGLILAFTIIPVLFIEEPRKLNEQKSDTPEAKISYKELFITLTPLYGYLIFAIYGIGLKLEFYNGSSTAIYILTAISVLLMLSTFMAKEPKQAAAIANERSFRKLLAAHSFTWLGVQTMFVYGFFFALHRFTDNDTFAAGKIIGWAFFLLNAFGSLFPIYFLEPLSKKIGRVNTHIISIGLMATGYIGIAFFASNQYILYVLMVILSIGWSSLVSLPFAIMTEKIDKSKMGLYMGVFNLSVVLPQLLASFVIGILIKAYIEEYSWIVFFVSGISLGISTFLWSFVKEKAATDS
ncbi:MAG: MFS transporter [Bacteroidota bacterium]|nr:MFS transporter [Bacteroidota bacterium]